MLQIIENDIISWDYLRIIKSHIFDSWSGSFAASLTYLTIDKADYIQLF